VSKQERKASIKYLVSQGVDIIDARMLVDYYNTMLNNFTDATDIEDNTVTLCIPKQHDTPDYYAYCMSMGGISI
jgi:hypothetical protein